VIRRTVLFLFSLAIFGAPASALALSCKYGTGALPVETNGHRPHGTAIPVDHIVVLMQENRSFDHYFGKLHEQGQEHARPEPAHASNPDPLNPGERIQAFHQDKYCEIADLDHSWNGSHNEWNNGRMDGFTTANQHADDPSGTRTMGYHDSTDLPYYYALYSTFAMSDRFYCSVLSQTFPNRFFLLAATAFGHIKNDFPQDCTQPCNPALEYSQRTIFNLMDESNPPVTWKVYFSQIPFAAEFAYVRNQGAANLLPISQFFVDAAAGTLPNVAFVDPIFVGTSNTENDEHPTANIQVGEEFASRVMNAVIASPQWPRSVAFLTYDEHGGFYDHVRPRRVCTPDDIEPQLGPGDVPGDYDYTGFRVPFVAVSPFSRAHYVSHRPHEFGSILRFIETRFDLPALTRRDANAKPLLEMFDFKNPPFAVTPVLPAAPIDQAHFDDPQCAEGTGSGGL